MLDEPPVGLGHPRIAAPYSGATPIATQADQPSAGHEHLLPFNPHQKLGDPVFFIKLARGTRYRYLLLVS
ncbi:MAG: hypothetical protein ABFS45_06135 [Pseudomonadota bacterium]